MYLLLLWSELNVFNQMFPAALGLIYLFVL